MHGLRAGGGAVVTPFTANCFTCKKRTYARRRDAQAAAKVIPGAHMTAYRCPATGNGWHLGHMPRDVVHGHKPKAEYEAGVRRRRRAAELEDA